MLAELAQTRDRAVVAQKELYTTDSSALIESLPERLRSAFLLHYYAGFGVREVATMLGRPEGTVKADLHHARARLKAALEDPRGA